MTTLIKMDVKNIFELNLRKKKLAIDFRGFQIVVCLYNYEKTIF